MTRPIPPELFYGRREVGYILDSVRPAAFITAQSFGRMDYQPGASRCASRPAAIRPTGANSTEHPSVTSSHYSDSERRRRFTDGRPLTGVQVRLAADGEILSRGPDLRLGYTDSALTALAFDEDGCYHTGDAGVLGM